MIGRRWLATTALGSVVLAFAGCKNEPPLPTGRTWTTPPPENVDGGLAAERFPRIGYRGGRFLRNPRVATITFKGDDPAVVARLEQFGDTITRSPWWHAVVESYCKTPDDCIGDGRPGMHVHLDDALPPDANAIDVSAILEREVKNGRFGEISSPSFGDLLLVAYPPKGVTLHDADTKRYCAGGIRATHRALRLGQATIVPYAIVPRCGDEAELTASASHEVLEATTNPDPAARGFAFEHGSKHLAFTAAGIEPVDPCGLLTMDDHWTADSGFVVQRAWSNRAAAAGHDPCVPSRADRPYVAVVAKETTVRLPKEGDSVTVALEATADRPAPPWAVSAFDVTGLQDRDQYVDLTLDVTTITAGQTAKLVIKLRKPSPRTQGIVGVVSTLGPHATMWPIAVVMR